MSASSWLAEAGAILAKEWRQELRARTALATLILFALCTLVVVSISLGPLALAGEDRAELLPALLWLILLFAAATGLPRAFVVEEETGTATLLRLAAVPSSVFAGKAAYTLSLVLVLELVTAPLFLGLTGLAVADPWRLVAALVGGGAGLAIASALIAAIISQSSGRGALFAVVAFPILLPPLVLSIELTRTSITGVPTGPFLTGIFLYDASVLVAGLMLFPVVWNP